MTSFPLPTPGTGMGPSPVLDPQPWTPATLAATYDTSIVLRRWAGAWIDFVALASFLLLPDWLLGNERYQATILVWLGLLVAYFPVSEGLTGRSLGKLLTFTVVVDAKGARPGLLKAFLRTLLRLVEVNPFLFGGLPAGIVAMATRHRQRLGDMVAQTYVLKSRDLKRIGTLG